MHALLLAAAAPSCPRLSNVTCLVQDIQNKHKMSTYDNIKDEAITEMVRQLFAYCPALLLPRHLMKQSQTCGF